MNALKQSVWLPTPPLTEQNLSNQSGRVFIVTGGYTGVGLELCKILYLHNATVYVAGRSAEKGAAGISAMKAAAPDSKGKAEFLQIDLADLTTIKKAADEFMAKEDRLDVLTQNAGVMFTPNTMKSAQGYEMQMATNCIGPFLFAQCLVPILKKTAKGAPAGSVRVTWAGSLAVDMMSPTNGIAFDEAGAAVNHSSSQKNYGQSKAGNTLLGSEFTKRYPFEETNIISNSWNPGNLKTELQRHMPGVAAAAMTNTICFEPRFGGYTELWAALSEEAGMKENNGGFIWPWGRMGSVRKGIVEAMKSKQEGGTGEAARFWEWCEKETKSFM